MKAAPALMIALAWLAATVGAPCMVGGRLLNLGFVAAFPLAGLAAVNNLHGWRSAPKGPSFQALGLGVLAFVVPAVLNGLGVRGALSAGRGCAALAWLALFIAFDSEMMRSALASAALALLVGNLILALASRWLPPTWNAFEIVQHEYVASTPRFRGLANTPAPAGVWALASIGLAEWLPRKNLRFAARVLGLIEAAATLSIALLALPALLVALLPQRRLRWCCGLAAALAAAFVLYFQPLELVVGSRHVALSRELSSYATDGLGPRFMPERTIALPGIALRGHPTAYGKLALRGLTCFAEHPLVGVGPGRFRQACPVMAMNTFGEWTDQRDSHNQLGGPLAELGLVGIGFLVSAWLVFRRDFTLKALTPWDRAVWVGLLVCAFGSEDLFTLPVLALLATQLERRAPVAASSAVASVAANSKT